MVKLVPCEVACSVSTCSNLVTFLTQNERAVFFKLSGVLVFFLRNSSVFFSDLYSLLLYSLFLFPFFFKFFCITVNLYELFKVTTRMGGYEKVCAPIQTLLTTMDTADILF